MKTFQDFLNENKGRIYVACNPDNENGKYELIFKADEDSDAKIISAHICSKDAEEAKRDYIKKYGYGFKYYNKKRMDSYFGGTNDSKDDTDNTSM